MQVNEWFKNKNKTKSLHIQIDDLVHKKCSDIIKGWRHSLTSDVSGYSTNPIFFNKKNTDWTSRTLANPYPPTSDNIWFLPLPEIRPFAL